MLTRTQVGPYDLSFLFFDNVCLQLPVSVVNRATTSTDRSEYLLNLLENILPPSDTKSVNEELKKTFTFNKYRTKHVRRKPKKATFLTARKRSELGLNKLDNRINLKYVDALALNQLWLEYMRQMLGVNNFTDLPQGPVEPYWDNIGQQLLKADFHGAKILVIRSKCPSLVGIHGIVLQDTKCTFRVIGEDSIIRTIPKDTAVFKICLGNVNLQLFGRELCVRPAERSVKKFKSARVPDL
ncbi:ribonuclease P protein subunit p29 isoform X1 [Neodiprion fabricii]|uniref:ribonuclease P protein subunit p29 isoform X1 n=1 Tax=Neodiprion fabricii TaxID=2872261 RepID=UPI001ED92C0F|nr:ribonuclease P protein subunit p29 isoform X1 [Neodiprion fabricii]